MGKQKSNIEKLYENVNQEYDLGTFDEFKKDMQDVEKRKKLHNAISSDYDLPDFNRFSSDMGFVEKKNPNIPTASSGTVASMGGSGKYVKAPQKQTTPTQQLIGDLKSGKAKIPVAKQEEKGIIETAIDTGVGTIVSGSAKALSGIAGLLGGSADLLINKKPENKKYTPLSNEWLLQKIQQQGEVKNPSWYTNQGIRDAFMGFAQKMNTIASEETNIAKGELGIKNTQKSTIDHVLEGNYKDAGKSLLVDIGTQIPNLAVMYGSGGSSAALGVLGAQSAGSNLQEQYEKDKDINSLDFAQGATVGIAEAVSEKLFDLDIKAWKSVGGKMANFLGDKGTLLLSQIKTEGVDAVKSKLIRSIGGLLKETAKGSGQEILEENIVSTVDFLTKSLDEDVLNPEGFDNFFKELGNNTITSGVIGGGSSLLAASASYKPLSKEEKIKVNKYDEVINSDKSSAMVKDIASKKKQEILDYGIGVENETYDKVSKLPIDKRIEAFDLNDKITRLESEKDSSMDIEMKDAIEAKISELKTNFDNLINQSNGNETKTETEAQQAETLLSNEGVSQEGRLGSSGTPIEDNPALKDVESTAKALDGVDAKQAVKGVTYFHGTSLPKSEQDFTTFDAEKGRGVRSNAFMGTFREQKSPFFFITSEESVANDFAKAKRDFFNDETKPKEKHTSRIIPFIFNEKDAKVLDLTGNDYEFVLEDIGFSPIDFFGMGMYEQDQMWEMLDTPEFATKLKELGYDAVKYVEPKRGVGIAVLNTNKLINPTPKGISESYHKAKADGSNPELVKAVEDILNTNQNDKENITGVQSSQQGGQESIQAESIQTGGGEATQTGGILQTPEAEVGTPSLPTTTPNTTPLSPEDAWSKSKDMMARQEQALLDMNKKKPLLERLGKKWFERQIGVIKAMGSSPEAKKAKAMMTTVAGARTYADEQFKEAEKNIYKNYSLEDEKNLDHILFHRRVMQIDDNYDKKGTERIKHPESFNRESSEMALEGLKNEIGIDRYNELNKSADEYFNEQNKILTKMKDGGLITEETYNNLKDDDYIKRVFLDHINDTPNNRAKTLGDYGLKQKQIQALDEGSTGLLLMDSRALLNAAYRSVEQRVIQNKANKALSEVIKLKPDIGKELNVKTTKAGNKEVSPVDNGYSKVVYFENGELKAFQMKNDLYNEWMDLEKSTTELDSWVRSIMGTAMLKRMATGINATFAIGNIPADYLNVIMFTNTFDNTNVFNGMQKLARSFASNFAQSSFKGITGKSTDSFKKLSDDFVKYGGGMEFLTTYGKPDDLVKRDKRYSPLGRLVRKTGDVAVKALAFTGEQSERAMRLAVFDEVRNKSIEKAGGIDKITQEQYDDISYEAAAAARKTMDFAKGGLWSKKLDNVSPYLNAAAQGTRVAAEYIYKNPKKFAKKWAEISTAVAAVTLYNAIVGDDEDWENIPEYEKNNYFILFKPTKFLNKKGENVRGYWRIKKTPALAPFFNLSEAGTMAAYNMATGRKFGASDSVVKREWEAINDALPIPIDPTQLPNKLPPVPKAALSYFANYDFYRKQKLVQGQEEDILPQYQGVYDTNVPAIYKKIGEVSSKIDQDMAISPKKLQKSFEMIITNPQTNTAIGGAYAILDKMINQFSNVPESWKNTDKEISTIFGGAKARVFREINPNYKSMQENSLKKLEKELNTTKVILRNEIRDMVESGKTKEEVRNTIISKKEISEEEKKTLWGYYNDVVKGKELAKVIPDYYKLSPIKYWKGSPEDKAKLLVNNIGLLDPTTEEFRDLLIQMKRMDIPVSSRFINEYQRIYRESSLEK